MKYNFVFPHHSVQVFMTHDTFTAFPFRLWQVHHLGLTWHMSKMPGHLAMWHKSHPLPSVADTSLDTEADLREETDGTNVKQRPGGVTEYFADCAARVWYLWMSVGMSATCAAPQGHARSWRRFVKLKTWDLPATRQRRLPIAFHAKPWKTWKNMALLALRVYAVVEKTCWLSMYPL